MILRNAEDGNKNHSQILRFHSLHHKQHSNKGRVTLTTLVQKRFIIQERHFHNMTDNMSRKTERSPTCLKMYLLLKAQISYHIFYITIFLVIQTLHCLPVSSLKHILVTLCGDSANLTIYGSRFRGPDARTDLIGFPLSTALKTHPIKNISS